MIKYLTQPKPRLKSKYVRSPLCPKAILDALNGLAYNDDKQITELHITKVYSTEDKITVKITEAENEREHGES